MKVLLKSDGKTVLFLDYSTTINANDEMWQTLDVEVEIPLIDGRESLWVIFQNVAEPLTLTNETMLTKGEDGHYRILIPDGVIVVPGEWTLQFLTRSYDVSSGTSLERVVSDVYTFTVEDGLPISDGKKVTNATIGALYAAATGAVATAEKAAAEMKESTGKIDALQSGLENTNQRVELNKDNIATNGLQIAGLESFVMTELGASLGLTYNPLDHIIQIALLNKQGGLLNSVDFDLPLESVVVSGAYDNETKSVVLTLQNGKTVSFPVGDLVNGLISSTEKGQPNGVATLGADGKVPPNQLPPIQAVEADLSKALTKNNRGEYEFAANERIQSAVDDEMGTYTVMRHEGFSSYIYGSAVSAHYSGLGVEFDYLGTTVLFYYPTDKTANDTFAMLSDIAENAVQKNTSRTNYAQAYGKNSNGSPIMLNCAVGANNNSLVRRDASGNFEVKTPTANSHPTSKEFVEEYAIPKDVNRFSSSSSALAYVLGCDFSGNKPTYLYQGVSTGDSGYNQIVKTTSDGYIRINKEPKNYNHPIRKVDLENAISSIKPKIGRGSFQPSAKVIAPKGSLFIIKDNPSVVFKYFDSSGTEQTYSLGSFSIVVIPEKDLVTGGNTGRVLVATISGLSTKVSGLSTNSSMETWFENTGSSVVEFWGIQADA